VLVLRAEDRIFLANKVGLLFAASRTMRIERKPPRDSCTGACAFGVTTQSILFCALVLQLTPKFREPYRGMNATPNG